MNRFIALFFLLGSLKPSSAAVQPALPYPPNLATNIPANADLQWSLGDTELIRNGNFETGTMADWTRVNDGGGANNNTYITDGTRRPFNQDVPYPPYAGNYSAQTDQDGPGMISMYQDVLVPGSANSVWLTWAQQLHNYFNTFVPDPPPLRQEFRVEIRTTDNTVITRPYVTAPDDPPWTVWTKHAFDLTPYKGRTLRIAFVQEQWRNFFHVFYDNISVRIRDTGPITYDVFFGTNSVPGSNDFRGTVANGSWQLPQLVPQQTYFWRVNARMDTNVFAGPVWRFTTAPVASADHFTWEPIASPKPAATPFSVSLTARDRAENTATTDVPFQWSAHYVSGIATNSLLPDLNSSAYTSFENSTVGYSFTPSADILVIGSRALPEGKVSLWTDAGVLLGSPPVQLFAGKTYRVGLFSPGTATNYLRFDGLSTFPHGVIHESFEGAGDAFPTQSHPARWWLVDLVYIVPTLTAPFLSGDASTVGGSWSASMTVPGNALVQLRATGASGNVRGISDIFGVQEILRLEMTRVGLRFSTVAGRQYVLESSTNLAPNSWVPFGETIPGSGNDHQQTILPSEPRQFFRLRLNP